MSLRTTKAHALFVARKIHASLTYNMAVPRGQQENTMLNRDEIASADLSSVTTDETLEPLHPGTHLLDYIKGAGITQYLLAKAIHVKATHMPPQRINEIVHSKRSIARPKTSIC